ncbi:nicastrin [Phtheirospermum japonicum]|uniref:Nicastrin n=1 Tax=Phtheirospermum japonicum TaxID=374723 RepID=A0A830D0Y7_9LAMI|nr:nicastrin [Phtheirospermum japonicum]
MDSKLSLLLSLLCLVARLRFSVSGETNSFESVPDLEKSMYTQIDGFPCVRLLNLSGEIGCSNPGRGNVVGSIVRFKNAKELMGPAAILVSPDDFESLLSRHFIRSRVSNDSDFARKVAGIFVESGTQVQNSLKGFSPDVKFPQAEFAPYRSNKFEWNPAGSGIMWKAYNFPIFLLSQNSTVILKEAMQLGIHEPTSSESFDVVPWYDNLLLFDQRSCSTSNEVDDYRHEFVHHENKSGGQEQRNHYKRKVAQKHVEWKDAAVVHKSCHSQAIPTRGGNHTGLTGQVGGTALTLEPKFDSSSTVPEAALMNEKNKKSYTKVVSEFDLVMQTTKSGTHDSDSCLKEGTCLPLGGYSVWSALPPINISSPLKAKPVVLAMTSMDSASFFRDKNLGAESPISGLIALLAVVDALSHLDGLEELNKQLVFVVLTGEAWGYLGSRRFFLESDQQSDTMKGLDLATIETVVEIGSVGKSYPQGIKTFFAHTAGATSSVNGTLNALQHAQDSLITESIMVKTASISNPGVPPSSLMTFLRKKPQISGLVLEDFDTAFSNEFYHSHLDGLSNINSSSIVAAASLVARTLYILAGGKDPSAINSIKINSSLVEELIGCLLDCEPGLSCGLVKHYISPSTTCPSHYVGVLLGEPSSELYPAYAGDISRFVWNFLADKTSIPTKNVSSSCPKACSGVNELCIKEADGKGVCVISTTRYVPAYSTRLKYDDEWGSWTVLPSNSSDIMGMEDPVWTESNWDTINVRVYTVQTTTYDRLILLLGILVTLFAYLLIVIARTLIRKALKQD